MESIELSSRLFVFVDERREGGREREREESGKVGRTRACSCPMRPSPSPTRLVLLPRLDWIAGTAIPLPIKWHRYPTYVHDSEKKRNVFEITMYLKALINGEGIVRFNIRVFERRARYFRNVTHVPNLFSQEDISIRRPTRVPRPPCRSRRIDRFRQRVYLSDGRWTISPQRLSASSSAIPNPGNFSIDDSWLPLLSNRETNDFRFFSWKF